MPLVKTEYLNEFCQWGLWEISESTDDLIDQLGINQELENIGSVKSEEKKKEKIAARLVLKNLIESQNTPFYGTEVDESGKPFLADHSYKISLSHSHNLAAAIIKQNGETGIDLELIQHKIIKIAPRVFNEEEMKSWINDPEKLTTLWCMKEVLYKLKGQKGLDFKKNLFIPPFNYESNGGITEALIRTPNETEFFKLKYFRFNNHIIAFNL